MKKFKLVSFVVILTILISFLSLLDIKAQAQTKVLPPTVTVSANPATIFSGQSSTLSWSSSNAKSCTNTGSKSILETSGTFSTGRLSSTTTYTITCTGAGGTASASATVTVLQIPTGTLTASSCTVAVGNRKCDVTLTWSTINPVGSSAVTTPEKITVSNANASKGTIYPVAYGVTNFYLYNSSFFLAEATATASCSSGALWNGSTCAYPMPTVTVSANPASISYNTASTIAWSSTNATSCTNVDFRSALETSGNFLTGRLSSTTTYTIACTGAGGTASASATVTVLPLDGGWSAWTEQNTTCGYSGNQTRSCTNPAPANGGAYCVGPDIQAYRNPSCAINGSCGISNGGNSYSAPSSGLCAVGSPSAIAGSGPWTWSCNGSNGGNTAICSSNKSIDGGWTPWRPASCPNTCGLTKSSQTRTCTNPTPVNGGDICVGSANQTCPATADCVCSSPLSQNVTVACDMNADSFLATSGLVTRSQQKSEYPTCIFPTPVNASNSTYVSDTCKYGPTGTLTATSCVIALGGKSCTSTLSWNTINPADHISAVTTVPNIIVQTANSGIKTYTIFSGARTFYLYNNAKLLAQAKATTSCASGTAWDGSACFSLLVPMTKLEKTQILDTLSAGADTSPAKVEIQTQEQEATLEQLNGGNKISVPLTSTDRQKIMNTFNTLVNPNLAF